MMLRCELTGCDTARSGDLAARGTSPIFNLCRLLVAAGADPSEPLECYRDGKLALRVKSIGAGAGFTIRETDTEGPRVVRWKAWTSREVMPPVRQNGQRVNGGAVAAVAT
jgi:hypothetical protein